MSYCRCNGKDSDVYVYGGKDTIICCGCGLTGYETSSRKEMIIHLIHDMREGDKVPDRVFDRLIDEIIKYGDEYSFDDIE